jgi:protein-tyrosine-phosphatase
VAEVGIDIAPEQPKILTAEAVKASDVVITMGCGDTCPFYPGKRYADWVLDDPAGQGIGAVRPIRDEIKRRVVQLIGQDWASMWAVGSCTPARMSPWWWRSAASALGR